jgi:dCTP deaminase
VAFWSGQKLTDNLERVLPDCNPCQIDGAACVLRIGAEIYVTPTSRAADAATQTIVQLKDGQSFAIPPGQFGFILTEEHVSVPADAMAWISFKTKMKWRGLVNVSGFHVDPGYKGRLIFAVYNAGPAPVHLRRGQDFFLIWFADLDPDYNPKHAERSKPGYESIDPTMVLAGQISSLDTLNERLRAVEDQQKYYQAVAAVLISISLFMVGVLFNLPKQISDAAATVKGGQSSPPPASPRAKPT